MAQRKVQRLECDRCIKATPAAVTIPFSFNGNAYEIDLCDPHADAMQRDMSAWTRLARDKQAESRERIFGDKVFTTIGKGRAGPPQQSTTLTLAPEVELEVKPYDPDFDYAPLWPTRSSSEDMARHDIKWPDVVAAVNGAAAITPSDKPDVFRYLTLGLSILVAEDGHVLGVAPRDPAEPLPKTTVVPRAAIRRRGKRGGIGNVGPRTFDDILTAIRATPGWEVTPGGKHWRVRGPEGQTSTIPKTSSDWRAAANAVSELRKIGLDLRQPAKVS